MKRNINGHKFDGYFRRLDVTALQSLGWKVTVQIM